MASFFSIVPKQDFGTVLSVSKIAPNRFFEVGTMGYRTRLTAFTVTTGFLACSPGFAVPIVAGGSAATLPEPAPGGVLVNQQTQPFATANYTGDLISKVWSNDPTNPYGGYTFTYQLSNAPGGSNALTRLTVTGFSGYATDVSYQLGTGDIAPSLSTRDPFGDVIGFSFVGDAGGFIMPGFDSQLLVVQTNALSYRSRIANVINGAVSTVNGFSPDGAITPEPLLASSVIAAGIVLTRRRRR